MSEATAPVRTGARSLFEPPHSRLRTRARAAMVRLARQAGWPGLRPRVFRRCDLDLLLDPSSMVDRCLIETGGWETDQIGALMAYMSRCRSYPARARIFLDIGAYFGLYALLMDRTGLFDRIVAFEPDPRNARQLAAQLFLNKTGERIELRPEAIADRSGTVRFSRSETHPQGNRAGIGMVTETGPESREVPMIALDDLFDFEDCLLIAKVDVEGREGAVLRGMRRLLARNRCVLQLEAFPQDRPATEAAIGETRLRIVREIYPDLYATNIDALEPPPELVA